MGLGKAKAPKKQPAKGRRMFVGISLVLATLILSSAAVGAFDVFWTSHAMETELKAARDHGFPTVPGDLLPKPAIKVAENAAPAFVELTKELGAMKWTDRADYLKACEHVVYGKWTAKDAALVRKALKRCDGLLVRASKAAQLPHCDFERSWAGGVPDRRPENDAFRFFVALLCARACDEPADKAFDDIQTAMKIGRLAEEEPCSTTFFTRVDAERKALQAVAVLVEEHSTEPAILARAGKFVDSMGEFPNVRRSLDGQMVEALLLCSKTADPHGNVEPTGPPSNLDKRIATTLSAREWTRTLRMLPKDNDDLDAFRLYRRWEEGLFHFPSLPGFVLHPASCFKDLYSPIVSPLFGTRLAAETRRALVREQIALFAYRNKHGSFPASLSEMGEPPFDPMGGKLRYRRTRQGFVLYGVGSNNRDDGGDSRPGRDGPDIAIRYPARFVGR